ncbi:MAG TPA: D-glycero-beta-D-manno-heptose 1-phosphate adenylyltransferase [Tepidisphaeraceae bacterium]|nr:D-glycero-beta-D-manno-heptose 1-phosphate adenylyltransferase [Tepidisphaeraceae bacterium]
MPSRLIELIERLVPGRVALVGDLMLDKYLYGNVERLSPEAPVPVLHYQKEELRLGGAGNVAACIAALGGRVKMIGMLGNDTAAGQVRAMLASAGVDATGVLGVDQRPTVCKMRLVGSAQQKNPQQMVRVDFEDSAPINPGQQSQILTHIEAALQDADMLCIEDYNKGLLSADLARKAIALAKARGLPVIVDPANIADYGRYAGATAVKSNRVEAERATGLPVRTPEQFPAAAEKLLSTFNFEAAIITLDRQGSYLATRDDQRQWLQTRPRQVTDVTGAGDMMLAMIAMARLGGADWIESATLANVAGGLEVEKLGVVPIRPHEIIHELISEGMDEAGKLRTPDQLQPELNRLRATGKKIVFTNGCFDIIHLGHVKYFQWAKSQGDVLVVGVNTDAGIRRLKGDKRPIISETDRLGVLEELKSIDYLVTFDEETPIKLIQQIVPDVLVKGADYAKEQVVGWDVVEKHGGKVALAPLIDGRSTSSVIQRILDTYK